MPMSAEDAWGARRRLAFFRPVERYCSTDCRFHSYTDTAPFLITVPRGAAMMTTAPRGNAGRVPCEPSTQWRNRNVCT